MNNNSVSALTAGEVLSAPLAHSVADLNFASDQLGEGFGVHYVEMGEDPDGEAPVRCALVQYRPGSSDVDFYSRPALLFVHGMTDYFFQDHVARFFHEEGFAVYGIDLRKCGRAWREGQTWHHVTSQALYDEEITIAVSLLASAHGKVVPVGHSTGGLDVTMWATRLFDAATRYPESGSAVLHSHVPALVCNSPWYGLQFDTPTRFIINRVFPIIGKIFPQMPLPGGINPSYGYSLHSDYAGEWNYDLTLKPILPRKKYVPWLVSVAQEIRKLRTGHHSTGVPTLILTSDGHHFARELSEQTYTNDPILMPSQMWEVAPRVSPHAHIEVIPDATHDVFLSALPVRSRALRATAHWLHDTTRNTPGSMPHSVPRPTPEVTPNDR